MEGSTGLVISVDCRVLVVVLVVVLVLVSFADLRCDWGFWLAGHELWSHTVCAVLPLGFCGENLGVMSRSRGVPHRYNVSQYLLILNRSRYARMKWHSVTARPDTGN